MLSNAEEGNIKNQYIDATFGTNVNEHEIFVNESPEKMNNGNNVNDNNYMLDAPNTLINQNNKNNENNKTSNSASSYGLNENIEEYGEGGNSLIKKMNNINSKQYPSSQIQNKDNKNPEIRITGEKIIYINKNVEKTQNSPNKFIMKRKLLKEIYIYNIKEKRFESIKDFKRDINIFKRFYQFSIYLNAKNNLYITLLNNTFESANIINVFEFICVFGKYSFTFFIPLPVIPSNIVILILLSII